MVFNRHQSDFSCDFTIEFNVKDMKNSLHEAVMNYEWNTGEFANQYGERLFKELKSKVKSKRWSFDDWGFAGRNNGWFALLCIGSSEFVTETQKSKIEAIFKKYKDGYAKAIGEHYKDFVMEW
jgi:hypothetical protein